MTHQRSRPRMHRGFRPTLARTLEDFPANAPWMSPMNDPRIPPKTWPTPHKNFNSQGSLHYLPKDSQNQLFKNAFRIWPGPPKNLVPFPEESPRDLSRTPKDFAKLPKDSPRHEPRSTKHFARPSQGFPRQSAEIGPRMWPRFPKHFATNTFPRFLQGS